MKEHKLLTVREVSAMLGVSEKEVMDLAEKGSIPAYKVGGVYLRFKRTQVQEFAKQSKGFSHNNAIEKYLFTDRLNNFFYFNDFYILSFIMVLLLLVIIFNT
jgi:excisionase family DNA binding protein